MKNSLRYIGKKSFRLISLLAAACILTFFLVSVSPIDPVQQYVNAIPNISMEQREEIAAYWGLGQPWTQRLVSWGSALLKGDLGTSLIYRRPVADIIGEKFLNSLALMMSAWCLSGVIGFTLGVGMGRKPGGIFDKIVRRICLFMSSVPTYWFGLVLLMIFAVQLKWFPIGLSSPIGMTSEEVLLHQRIQHLILPALTLSLSGCSNVALHTRQKLIDVMESDYVLFARARGESEFDIIKSHGIRNILLPAMTLQFSSFSELFGGSVLAENVFSYPGLGQAVSLAGLQSDLPLLMGITIFSALFVFVGNFLADLLYGFVNPQIREGDENES